MQSREASAADPGKKGLGLLVGVEPEEVLSKGIDIYKPDLTIENLWGPSPPTGGALLDKVIQYYGDGVHDVPWFFESENGTQRRTIERSPLSREIQNSTVQCYKERILKESISQVAAGARVQISSEVMPFSFSSSSFCRTNLNREPQPAVGTAGSQPQAPHSSGHCRALTAYVGICVDRMSEDMSDRTPGEPIFKFSDRTRSYPVEAGTWNHRAAAFYAAVEEAPKSPNVEPVLRRGLISVKFIDFRIPDAIWRAFIITHNNFHQGSGTSFQDLIQDAIRVEADWERHVSFLGMGMFFKDWDSYRKSLSVAHILMKRYGIWEDCMAYWNKHVDFISAENVIEPMSVVATMHAVILLVTGNMSKYYEPKTVPKASSSTSGERLPGWTFKHHEQDGGRMNLINLPMAESLSMKKMTDEGKRKDDSSDGGKGKGQGLQEKVANALDELGLGSKKRKTGTHDAVNAHDDKMDGDDGFPRALA
eukprot:s125_g20.t1